MPGSPPRSNVYLPADRLRAIAAGQALSRPAAGTVLFADIAGFSTLTDQLHTSLGARRGAETLSAILDALYTPLVAAVDATGGSVISTMHQAMEVHGAVVLPDGSQQALGIKLALASGTAERLVVGDPAVQTFDLLTGAPVARAAMAEHLARPGDIMLDAATVDLPRIARPCWSEVISCGEISADMHNGLWSIPAEGQRCPSGGMRSTGR